jgi:hypothetical protein
MKTQHSSCNPIIISHVMSKNYFRRPDTNLQEVGRLWLSIWNELLCEGKIAPVLNQVVNENIQRCGGIAPCILSATRRRVISFMVWWLYACVHWLGESARPAGLQPWRTPRRRQILHAFAGIRTQISRRPSSSPVTTPTALTGISIATVLT